MLYGLGVIKRCVLLVVLILPITISLSFCFETNVVEKMVNEYDRLLKKDPGANSEQTLQKAWQTVTGSDVASDPYIQSFLLHCINMPLKYKEGCLLLYANPRVSTMICKALYGIL
jgi:hypothetical protein